MTRSNSIGFLNYPPVHQVEQGKSVYVDAVNHCQNYQTYLVGGSKVSSVHECTHGINSQIRNAGPSGCNGFYFLMDRAFRVQEPEIRKSACIPFIPSSLRFSRYSLYVEGQSEWENQPLYIFDEWVAYQNGAACVIDLGKDYNEGSTDYIFGPVEFIAYGTAVVMAANAKEPLSPELRELTAFCLERSFELYTVGMKILPWEEAHKCMEILRTSPEAQKMRDFWRDVLAIVPFSTTTCQKRG
jgi:hypothetical protein